MDAILVMLNNYFHDLAVGVLVATLGLSHFAGREAEGRGAEARALLRSLVGRVNRIAWGALAFVIAGGVVRTLTYRSYEWVDAAGRGQVAALVAKHVVLVAAVAVALALHVRTTRRFARLEAEAGEGA